MVAEEIIQGTTARAAVRELRRLSEAEFDAFYQRNGRALMGYITRLCGDATLSEDLFQKAFYLFVRSPLPVPDDDQMRAYLYRIATNVVHDHWRKSKRQNEEMLEQDVADPARAAASFELRHDLQKTFNQLSPNERALLWLAHVEGLDHREVAAHVGVREKSVRVLLHRARRKLAALLHQIGNQGKSQS